MDDLLARVRSALAGEDAAALAASVPIGDSLARIRDARAASIIVLIGPDVPAVEHAMLIAAIGPLAVELAPDTRIAVLDILAAAAPDDVVAAARFVAGARSTTGQVLTIGD